MQHPPEQLGPVEREEAPAAPLGVELVGEGRLDAHALVSEGRRADRRRQVARRPLAVLLGLQLDIGERLTLFLGLEGADGLPVYVPGTSLPTYREVQSLWPLQ